MRNCAMALPDKEGESSVSRGIRTTLYERGVQA
jgi:hypothetical protein